MTLHWNGLGEAFPMADRSIRFGGAMWRGVGVGVLALSLVPLLSWSSDNVLI